MRGDHEALKRAIRAARAQAGFTSDDSLAIAAGIHLQTIQNWMYGKTVPRPAEVLKLARATGKSLDYFMAAYEGREEEPPNLVEAVRAQTAAINRQTDQIARLLGRLEELAAGAVADGVRDALEEAVRTRDIAEQPPSRPRGPRR